MPAKEYVPPICSSFQTQSCVCALYTPTHEIPHLEVACVDLHLVSMDPMIVEGDIIFENQGGSALTIRGFAGGASRLIELSKTSRFLGLFESTRPVPTVRVNAHSVKELSGDLGYRLTLSEFPSNYGKGRGSNPAERQEHDVTPGACEYGACQRTRLAWVLEQNTHFPNDDTQNMDDSAREHKAAKVAQRTLVAHFLPVGMSVINGEEGYGQKASP